MRRYEERPEIVGKLLINGCQSAVGHHGAIYVKSMDQRHAHHCQLDIHVTICSCAGSTLYLLLQREVRMPRHIMRAQRIFLELTPSGRGAPFPGGP